MKFDVVQIIHIVFLIIQVNIPLDGIFDLFVERPERMTQQFALGRRGIEFELDGAY